MLADLKDAARSAALDTEHYLDAEEVLTNQTCTGLNAVQTAHLEMFAMLANSSCVYNLTVGPAGVVVN